MLCSVVEMRRTRRQSPDLRVVTVGDPFVCIVHCVPVRERLENVHVDARVIRVLGERGHVGLYGLTVMPWDRVRTGEGGGTELSAAAII